MAVFEAVPLALGCKTTVIRRRSEDSDRMFPEPRTLAQLAANKAMSTPVWIISQTKAQPSEDCDWLERVLIWPAFAPRVLPPWSGWADDELRLSQEEFHGGLLVETQGAVGRGYVQLGVGDISFADVGDSLKAVVGFQKGDRICAFYGRWLSVKARKHFVWTSEFLGDRCVEVLSHSTSWVVQGDQGCPAAFCNHSSNNSNALLEVVMAPDSAAELQWNSIVLKAKSNILPGTFITIDYGQGFWESPRHIIEIEEDDSKQLDSSSASSSASSSNQLVKRTGCCVTVFDSMIC
jgi:hypothetical protein